MDTSRVNMSSIGAMEGEEIELDLSDEASREAIATAKRTLVGRIIVDKVLNRNAVKDIVSKAWNMQEDLKIVDMGPNTYLFTFTGVEKVKMVLEEGFWIPRKDLPRTWIFIKYERLQDFCYNCGVIGHDYRKCKEEKAMAIHVPNRPRYGPSLSVPQAKAMATIVLENINRARKLRKENDDDVAGKDVTQRQESEVSTNEAGETAQHNENDCQSAGTTAPVVEKAKNVGPKSHSVVDLCVEMCGSSRKHTGPPNFHTSPTMVDIYHNQIRAGLGPQNFEDLDLVAEDIGLKEKKILWEVPSPVYEGSSSFGVHLSKEEIQKCREKCYVESTLGTQESVRAVAVCQPEIEGQLILGIQQVMTLKRQRSDDLSIPISQGGHMRFLKLAKALPTNHDLVDVEVISATTSIIHTSISHKETAQTWETSFVYGSPIPSLRQNFWIDLAHCHFHRQFPRSIIGDFNEVLHPHEKVGLRSCNMSMLQLFRDFVNQMDLLDQA
ncbi:Zinc finger, CCHC-type [Sesbania bispinosa]|nr:Zinc finger, CCHC-type [Sesbania bispinosa]